MANVVVQTAFIGDLLLTIPLLKNLGHYYRDEELILVCRKGFGELFQNLRLVDRAIEVNKGDRSSYKDAVAFINENDPNFLFCPHESLRSAIFAAQIKAKYRIGFKKWWNAPFFGTRFKRPMNYPDAIRQLSLLGRMHPQVNEELQSIRGQDEYKNPRSLETILDFDLKEIPDWASMSVADQVEIEDSTRTLVAGDKPIVFLAPGSVWRTKRWTIEGFIALGRKLTRENHQVVLVGAPDEAKICELILKQVDGAVNLCGETSLWQVMQLFKMGKALISNDSGAMHMASCMELPTVAIFGPTTLKLGYRPWNVKAAVVQTSLDCRPCGKHGANQCPIGTHDCMNKVGFEEVYKAFSHLTG